MKYTWKNVFLLPFAMVIIFSLAACNPQPAEAAPGETEPEQSEGSQRTLKEGEIIVTTVAELETALTDQEITGIYIGADIEISSELFIEREDTLPLTIDKGNTLTISAAVTLVGFNIVNDGTLLINGTFDRGITNLTNNGSVIVNAGGTFTSGMSDTLNQGEFQVAKDGSLSIERGSTFHNSGTLMNDGYLLITDGGQLNNESGSITNNGTMDLYSFFNGDIATIAGSGTLNDYRE